MDARQRRSRENLAAAILTLATAKPITLVTAAELASAAGVNRSTLYEHASSAFGLLESTLRDELDDIRARRLVGVDAAHAPAAIAASTRDVLEHVEAHAEIYRRGLSPDGGAASLQPMLAAHFEGSVRVLIAQHSIRADAAGRPDAADDTTLPLYSDELSSAISARFVATGLAGAVSAWIESEAPRDIDAFASVYRQLLPPWWPFDR